MRIARIDGTNDIVDANDLIIKYPNYNTLVFVCIDQECSVRMTPACIENHYKLKPHFKKYRNRKHKDDCEYAILSKSYIKDDDGNFSKIDIIKKGYPSVFNINKSSNKESDIENVDIKILDDGITASNKEGVFKYGFDEKNLEYNSKNKVTTIKDIVKFYIAHPNVRDVIINFNDIKIQYRHLFKRIDSDQDPSKLLNNKIYYGKIMITPKNKSAFETYPNNVYIKLLGHHPQIKKTDNKKYYSLKIDKTILTPRVISILKNSFKNEYEKSENHYKNIDRDKTYDLYFFCCGELSQSDNTLINVIDKHIVFKFTDVPKTNLI